MPPCLPCLWGHTGVALSLSLGGGGGWWSGGPQYSWEKKKAGQEKTGTFAFGGDSLVLCMPLFAHTPAPWVQRLFRPDLVVQSQACILVVSRYRGHSLK